MTAATAEWLRTDFYEVLGVPETASAKEVQRAYRRLARQLHPDTRADGEQSDDRFKAVTAAYEVLSDDGKRREYDELRAAARERRSRSTGPRGVRIRTGGEGYAGAGSGVYVEDVLGGFGSPFDDLFRTTGPRARRASRPRPPRRGADQEAPLRLPFEQAVRGTTVDLVVTEPGTGSRTVSARIPPGVRDGQTLRLPGRGGAGVDGGPPGDLLVRVEVDPHPVFGRTGRDLTVTVPVTFPEAALGAQVPVPTLDGPVTVRIPAGTASGTTLRVPGRGVPATRRSPAGDLLVTVQVDVPQQLTESERAAVEQLAAALRADPRRVLAA